ncbi:hypothetical protein P280DRAFT_535060 [Massarina eburnea CBS 473.64]|uniref:Uncharacterized protein n=1 Tax=Massarina eburnea CBS 473.64 TaxID=1395130 RepID=A0A6A6SDQ3_9PLEO|nr:hypothetical protein P280DRAFT_535060 [Massarina eburnea CBS 473.64]
MANQHPSFRRPGAKTVPQQSSPVNTALTWPRSVTSAGQASAMAPRAPTATMISPQMMSQRHAQLQYMNTAYMPSPMPQHQFQHIFQQHFQPTPQLPGLSTPNPGHTQTPALASPAFRAALMNGTATELGLKAFPKQSDVAQARIGGQQTHGQTAQKVPPKSLAEMLKQQPIKIRRKREIVVEPSRQEKKEPSRQEEKEPSRQEEKEPSIQEKKELSRQEKKEIKKKAKNGRPRSKPRLSTIAEVDTPVIVNKYGYPVYPTPPAQLLPQAYPKQPPHGGKIPAPPPRQFSCTMKRNTAQGDAPWTRSRSRSISIDRTIRRNVMLREDIPLPSIEVEPPTSITRSRNRSIMEKKRKRPVIHEDDDDDEDDDYLSENVYAAQPRAPSDTASFDERPSKHRRLSTPLLPPAVTAAFENTDGYNVPRKLVSTRKALGRYDWKEYVEHMEKLVKNEIDETELNRHERKLFQTDEGLRAQIRKWVKEMVTEKHCVQDNSAIGNEVDNAITISA